MPMVGPEVVILEQSMIGLSMVGHMKDILVQAIGQKNIQIVEERLKVPLI